MLHETKDEDMPQEFDLQNDNVVHESQTDSDLVNIQIDEKLNYEQVPTNKNIPKNDLTKVKKP